MLNLTIRKLSNRSNLRSAINNRGSCDGGKCIINVLWLSKRCQMPAKCQLHGHMAWTALLADHWSFIDHRPSTIDDRRSMIDARWSMNVASETDKLTWRFAIDLASTLTFKRQTAKCHRLICREREGRKICREREDTRRKQKLIAK